MFPVNSWRSHIVRAVRRYRRLCYNFPIAVYSQTTRAAVAAPLLRLNRESVMPPKQWLSPPPMQIDPQRQYRARMMTSKGEIVIDLAAAYAPKTVNNFVFLANEGFYNGVVFHRVISNFVVQGGDPTGTGRGGPGYKFEDEVDPKKNPLKHETGVLSMANAGPNTNGSQFFITHSPQPHLDGKHTVFGRVVSGMDVVNAIRQGDQILNVTIEVL